MIKNLQAGFGAGYHGHTDGGGDGDGNGQRTGSGFVHSGLEWIAPVVGSGYGSSIQFFACPDTTDLRAVLINRTMRIS